ncbi:DUF397 domain-containing protein [Spongiactinospora gelatinilytica]|uniref:DUF397 domain-containing protein n=1 Tax=Spongiactinospora gelatinilytica TaxID=2666298 RepID=A0A2W2FZ67_9ACTN|nr:DUF397 domain-containing protein [Spongiactinospora gelatinilytica]PZG40993.1 DUF397 domain-containing protein [Spongiactinospora gelatinilytica]
MAFVECGALSWRKSSYSGANNSDCVEVATLPGGGRAIRDSKDVRGAVLRFSAAEWAWFVGNIKTGEFD